MSNAQGTGSDVSAAGSDGVDRVIQNGRWSFDQEVAAVFDNMLERSIPQYLVMREAVHRLSRRIIDEAPGLRRVVDLGCSRGEAIAALAKESSDCQFTGVEVSPAMLAAARSRFVNDRNVEIIELDLRHDYPQYSATVTLGILTMQFIPLEYRQAVFRRVYNATDPGGAFLLVEKVLGASALVDDAMVAEYLDMKRRNGYSEEEIDRKRLALQGVLVPVTAGWNEELIRVAGFSNVDCFWRWMNFAGWIAFK